MKFQFPYEPIKLMSPAEIAVVRSVPSGFVENYTDFASAQTNAPWIYHMTLGLCLLSVVVGKRAFEPLIKSHPNLWAILLGPSTLNRKSTSIRIARRLLDDFDPTLSLPNDFSPEAFVEVFANRPQATGILFRDELSGFLTAMTHAGYLGGLKEILIKMYDGDRYERTLRKLALMVDKPFFTWVGGAVTEKLLEACTDADIYNGFLVRFFLVLAQPNSWRPLPYGGPALEEQHDQLIETLKGIREVLDERHTLFLNNQQAASDTGATFVMDNEAKNRWDKYAQAVETESSDPLADKINGRASPHSLKLMMLFACERLVGSNPLKINQTSTVVVPLDVVLKAIYWTEVFRDLTINTLMSVGRTTESNLVERIRLYITNHPAVRRAKLMRRFDLKPREMDEIRDTLMQRGQVVAQMVKPARGTACERYWDVAAYNETVAEHEDPTPKEDAHDHS